MPLGLDTSARGSRQLLSLMSGSKSASCYSGVNFIRRCGAKKASKSISSGSERGEDTLSKWVMFNPGESDQAP